MEVTPEIYAWLSEHKILNVEKTLIMKKDGILVDESVCTKLINGFHWDKILFNLEKLYNKFYKIKLNYTHRLEDTKVFQDQLKGNNMDKTLRVEIWKIIGEVIGNFGIDVREDRIKLISEANYESINSLLRTIFVLVSELTKRNLSNPASGGSISDNEDLEKKDQNEGGNMNLNLKSTKNKTANKISPDKSNKNLLIESTKTNPAEKLIEKKNEAQRLDTHERVKKSMTSVRHIKKPAETLNLNTLTTEKKLENSDSPLEFFILTLAKNLEMKPRQAVALLSNNRKYLIQISNRGIKGNYNKMINWYQDVVYNYHTLITILNSSQMKDAKSMTYAVLSVGLFSKSFELAEAAFGVIYQLEADIKSDIDWLLKEGMDAFVFCINKHKGLRKGIFNLIYKMSGADSEKIFKELFNLKKFSNKKIYEIISNILDLLRELGKKLFDFFKQQITDFCFKENSEKTSAVSILADCWIEWDLNSESDEKIIANILKFYKNSIREKSQKILQMTSIAQLFRILMHIASNKDANAPIIYRTLVFYFLENYDDCFIREIFLNNFMNLFTMERSIPLEILLDPYLRQIKNSSNYEIADFTFIKNLLKHPKINFDIIRDVLDFSFYVSMTNMFYSRMAKILINEILTKFLNPKILGKIKGNNQEIIQGIFGDFEKFIKSSLKIFLKNPKDYMILESTYDILNYNIPIINRNVENEIIETVQIYRAEFGSNSTGLLSLLWNFNTHDEILLNLEEKYTDKFDQYYYDIELRRNEETEASKVKTVIKKKAKMKPEEVIKAIREKRIRKAKEKEEQMLRKYKREKRMVKNLTQKVLNQLSDAAREVLETNNSIINNSNVNLTSPIENLSNNNEIFNVNTSIFPADSSIDLLSSRDVTAKKNPLFLIKNFQYFVNLEEQEKRELIAIEGIFRENRKQSKRIFRNFSTDAETVVTRTNLYRLIRELGIDNDLISLNELSSIIRLTFGKPLNNFTKDQFGKLVIQIAYTVFTKINYTDPLSRCLQKFFMTLGNYLAKKLSERKNFAENFSLLEKSLASEEEKNKRNKEKEKVKLRNKTENKILNYLRNKVENVLLSEDEMIYVFSPNDLKIDNKIGGNDVENDIIYKEDNINKSQGENSSGGVYENSKPILMPPGYKKKLTTKMEYDYTLKKKAIYNLIPESKAICVEIFNEILQKNFGTNIIEPYVKIFNYFKVSEEILDPKKKWSDKISIVYTKMDKSLEKEGVEAGDLMEEMLRGIEKGRDNLEKIKFLGIKEKEEIEENKKKEIEDEEKERLRLIRKKEINEQLKKLNEEKEKENKQKELEEQIAKQNKQKELKLLMQREIEINEKRKKDLLEKRKEKEKESEESRKLALKKIEDNKRKKEVEKEEFFKKQKRKLKEQFKEIKTEKDTYISNQMEILNIKMPDRNVKKILEKDKKYFEFEKNINDNIEKLLQRTDIREFLANYENHFRQLYEIYCRLGNNKITFFNEEAIHAAEFKEFCSNFLIYGLLINNEQMNYIFKNISKRNVGTADDLFFLRYNDFLVSFVYISIFMKEGHRGRRIIQKDIDNYEVNQLKNLLEFIGLKLPYDKRELEFLVRDRRNLTAKQMVTLHQSLKRERQDIIKPKSARRINLKFGNGKNVNKKKEAKNSSTNLNDKNNNNNDNASNKNSTSSKNVNKK